LDAQLVIWFYVKERKQQVFHKTLAIFLLLISIPGCIATLSDDGYPDAKPSNPFVGVSVPNLTNMSLIEAQSVNGISALDLHINYLAEDSLGQIFGLDKSRWPKNGTIIAQRPSPEAVISLVGNKVMEVDVASWQPEPPVDISLMPDLIKEPAAQQSLIANESISVVDSFASLQQVLSQYGGDTGKWPASGTIVAQSPAPGAAIDGQVGVFRLNDINAYISNSFFNDFKGMHVKEANEIARSNNLRVSWQDLTDGNLARIYGTDIDKWPAEDTVIDIKVSDDLSITTTIAKWSERELFPEPLPSVVGQSTNDAVSALVDLGYQVDLEEIDISADSDNVLSVQRRLGEDFSTGIVVLQVAARSTMSPEPTVPDPVEPTLPVDSDNDGIADEEDQCPDTDVSVNVDGNGCTTADLAKRLEYGRYYFLPDSRNMEANRNAPYKIRVTLHTAPEKTPQLTTEPTDEEFDTLLGELPDSLVGDIKSAVNSPYVQFIDERWAPEMKLMLSASNPDTVEILSERTVEKSVRRPMTTWEWNIRAKCTGTVFCEPMELDVDAKANFGVGRTYDLFKDQRIIVEITPVEIADSIWEEWKAIIISGVLTVIILPLILVKINSRYRKKNEENE